jgi:hypothetical protein
VHTERISQRDDPLGRQDFFSPEELQRWADLVASGEVTFPENLSPGGCKQLAEEVRRRRRSRLVKFVARAIAEDIRRSRGQQQGDN